MNRQDSMQFEKLINTIQTARKTNISYKLMLQTLQHIQFRFGRTIVHQNSVLDFRLNVYTVEY